MESATTSRSLAHLWEAAMVSLHDRKAGTRHNPRSTDDRQRQPI